MIAQKASAVQQVKDFLKRTENKLVDAAQYDEQCRKLQRVSNAPSRKRLLTDGEDGNAGRADSGGSKSEVNPHNETGGAYSDPE